MKFLIDTHILLWAAYESTKLSIAARDIMEDEGNELFYSAASLWEIAIKNGLGREDFQVNLPLFRRGLLDNGYRELSITSSHAIAVATLPQIHEDPFDRMLLAQALHEGITLLTSDGNLMRYSVPLRLA